MYTTVCMKHGKKPGTCLFNCRTTDDVLQSPICKACYSTSTALNTELKRGTVQKLAGNTVVKVFVDCVKRRFSACWKENGICIMGENIVGETSVPFCQH